MASLSELKNKLSAVCGEIKTMPVNTVPDGWLSCNGSAISRTTYSKLFSKLSTTYGVGDGSTTFNLPAINGSGRFIRGSGGNAAAIGTAQADQFQGHNHNYTSNGQAGGAGPFQRTGNLATQVDSAYMGGPNEFSTYGVPRVGNETRPANYAMVFCIKY